MSPIERLESKLAFLERASQDLGDVVYRQQQELDALKARVERLVQRLEAAEERSRDYTAEDERPPHY
ncbi:MAG: SlyX family protein [Gammaproteobacteria bacterium]